MREAIAMWLRRIAERLAPIGPPPSYADACEQLRREMEADLDVAAERYAKRLRDGGIFNETAVAKVAKHFAALGICRHGINRGVFCDECALEGRYAPGAQRCPPYPALYRVK